MSNLGFYARAYGGSSGTWIDNDFRRYGIAVYAGNDFPGYGSRVDGKLESEILYRENNIGEIVVANRNNQYAIRFCLTESYTQNLIQIQTNDTTSGGIVVDGESYGMFGSVGAEGTVFYVVVSDASLAPGTKTGTAYLSSSGTFSIYGNDPLTEASSAGLIKLLSKNPVQPDDPFAGGGTSEPGGGGGTFDADSDQIPDSSLPSLSVADTGFARVYNPTLAQLKSLAEYMWTSDSFLETLLNHAKQLVEDPMNAIISLNLLPCPIPNGAPVDVKVLYISTGVRMSPATTQFVDVDCGSVKLDQYYGSALDYSPYTKVSLFLPYIGQVTLDVDEVMNRTINIKYRIDIVSGMCVAKVLVDSNVMYQFSGHCAINMPLNSADFSGYIGALVQAAKVGTTVIAGAVGGAPTAATVAGLSPGRSSTSTTTTTVRNPATGRQITAGTERQSRSTAPASWGEIANKTISNSVSAVMGSKTIVEHAGSFSGNSGYLGVRRPYLIIERPRMCNPAEYGQLNGYPSLLTLEFSSLSGYTEVQEVQLTGLSATNPELSELSLLLKGGVIF